MIIENRNEFASRLRATKGARDLTFEQMSEMTGISRITLSEIARGKKVFLQDKTVSALQEHFPEVFNGE